MEKLKKEVEVKEEQGEQTIKEEKKPKVKRFSFKIIIITLSLLGLLGAGFFAYGRFLPTGKNHQSETKPGGAETKNKEPKVNSLSKMGLTYPLDPFIVNLADDSGERYLKVNLTLELGNEIVKGELDERLPQIRDSILILLSSKSFVDIGNVQGKLKLREEIGARLNNTITTGQVKEVYFTEFVVQ